MLGVVEGLWRYPVTSTGGESLARVLVAGEIAVGDEVAACT
ncbi:hypothetical protein ACQPW3_19745 [Actinosynnema sp. CA-248983]